MKQWPPKIGAIVTMADQKYVVTSTIANHAFGKPMGSKAAKETALIKHLVT